MIWAEKYFLLRSLVKLSHTYPKKKRICNFSKVSVSTLLDCKNGWLSQECWMGFLVAILRVLWFVPTQLAGRMCYAWTNFFPQPLDRRTNKAPVKEL